jgi:hypothetical protein
MTSQESIYRQQYSDLINLFKGCFPGIEPPDSSWFVQWLARYGFADVCDAIQRLQSHPLKPRFTTDSTGRALSALLRDRAMGQAVRL